ncbi:hypothetical protein LCGC14_2298670 [marine sediment metagenome]|uniref:Uncharacterized protein n=1 Tax=marine sediment metagenome TaxID=412755 RepID=A0A0F9CPK1_9ZZZZ
MTWKAIKFIYREVLICNSKIKYFGGNKYKITKYFDNGQKFWEAEFENDMRHGKSTGWTRYGEELYNDEYIHGKLI